MATLDPYEKGQLVRVWYPLIIRVYADDDEMAVGFADDEMTSNSLTGESLYDLINDTIDPTSFYHDTRVEPKFEVVPE